MTKSKTNKNLVNNSILLKHLDNYVKKWKKQNYSAEVILTFIKEFFQIHVLDWLYNYSNYLDFTMYGGTLLRVAFDDFNRLSEDLDFQVDQMIDILQFVEDLNKYFLDKYFMQFTVLTPKTKNNTTTIMLTIPGLLKKLNLGLSKTAFKLKIDVNYFPDVNKFAKRTYIVNRFNKSILVKSYDLSTLMASKVVAILKTKQFWRGKKYAKAQPRDVYDLLWYLNKGIYPNLTYLRTQGLNYKKLSDVYNDLQFKILNLDDTIFTTDLAYLMINPEDFSVWYQGWRQKAEALFKKNQIIDMKNMKLEVVFIDKLALSTVYGLTFVFNNNQGQEVVFVVKLDDSVLQAFIRKNLLGLENDDKMRKISQLVAPKIQPGTNYHYFAHRLQKQKAIKILANLFYTKIIDFVKAKNYELLQKRYETKELRNSTINLDPNQHVFVDVNQLTSVDFANLL